jgi:acetyl-CoA C-acetyltransferase
MPQAVVISALRTAIGTSFKGALTETPPEELARVVVGASVGRAQLDPRLFDDVVLAESNYGGGALARHAAVECGLIQVPGTAINPHCAGGLTAAQMAAASIRSGMDRAVIAGGTHSASLNPVQKRRVAGTADEWIEDWQSPAHPDRPEAPNRDMTITVGWNTAVEAGITREEMDAWALRSHERAVAAIDAGDFHDEIVPVRALQRDGTCLDFSVDEHPRRSTSLERLAALKPVHPEIAGFSITAGNSSGINDADAALAIVADDLALAEGRPILAAVRAWANIGIDPRRNGMADVDVIRRLFDRSRIGVDDVALPEINEAFASVPIAACRELAIDDGLVNTTGSGAASARAWTRSASTASNAPATRGRTTCPAWCSSRRPPTGCGCQLSRAAVSRTVADWRPRSRSARTRSTWGHGSWQRSRCRSTTTSNGAWSSPTSGRPNCSTASSATQRAWPATTCRTRSAQSSGSPGRRSPTSPISRPVLAPAGLSTPTATWTPVSGRLAWPKASSMTFRRSPTS